VGEATLDLTQLPTDGTHVVVHSKVSLGHLIVLVPDGVPVRVHAKLRIGDITEFGNSLVNGNGHIERTRSYGPAGDPRVEVEASMGTGQIEVRHG
jgi:predicted membrane protein